MAVAAVARNPDPLDSEQEVGAVSAPGVLIEV